MFMHCQNTDSYKMLQPVTCWRASNEQNDFNMPKKFRCPEGMLIQKDSNRDYYLIYNVA